MLERMFIGSSAEATDPNFENVTLLLHGDGSNGAQNNTFLDSSPNNFTITRNGDTAQGSFSPFSKEPGKWGVYFPPGSSRGSTSNAPLSFTPISLSGNFTVECWLYLQSDNTNGNCLLGSQNWTAGNYQFSIDTGTLRPGLYDGSTSFFATGAITVGAWYHLAFVRSGSTVTFFINGIASGTATTSAILSVAVIGALGNYGAGVLGYVSNLRIATSALYTGNFTPSTAPLTAVSGTSLLCCQDNRFKDNSPNNFTLTPYGNVAVTPFSPFANSAEYSASANGGGGYFDGGGDYLIVTSTPALAFGTSDFTIEGWFLFTNGADRRMLVANGVANGLFFAANVNSAGIEIGAVGYVGGVKSSTAVPINSWVHLAATRQSGTVRLFQNGVLVASGSDTRNYSQGQLCINGEEGYTTNWHWAGHISNLRIVKGTALYTSNFTPPTAPLTAVTNTQLLLNFTNAGIIDHTGFNNLETVGNAQISTSVKKYGTGAMYFNGTGDVLLVPPSNFDFGAGEYTVEFWTNVAAWHTYDQFIGQWAANGTNDVFQFVNFNGAIGILLNGSNFKSSGVSTSSIATNTWHHFAFVRNGSMTKFYLNGTGYTIADNPSWTIQTSRNVGIGRVDSQGGFGITGYIDDLRITKGVARYTANFTPPAEPFADK